MTIFFVRALFKNKNTFAMAMDFIHTAAILAIDNRFRTPGLQLKCLETSFGAQNKRFQSLGTQDGSRVIKAHWQVFYNMATPGSSSIGLDLVFTPKA